ncbi:GMC oxidoreductase [Trametes cinnabarina]|uniref:GMC oxidoreductase n=1 Tax=Pycnoporus cinnabarinus TaxID=5643 RepID=A0A060SUN5_PYCCI|nr:GMC oxidoreductase [Trametes cinnabarina]
MPLVVPDDLSSIQPDYVIVGGGTSGLVLAARLTEDPDIHVVVVEAGLHHGSAPEIDIPGYMGRSIANPKFDWTFLSVPQKRANNRVVLQPRGKGLGGSSLVRPDLSTDSVKSETLQLPDLTPSDALAYAAKPDPNYHGIDGPIKNSFGPIWAELHLKLFEAAEALGIPRNPETGNGKNDGCMTSLVSVDATTAKRSYAASAYLEPNLHRKNLHVLTGAHVTKVLLTSGGDLKRASGVEYIKDGKKLRIENVKRDVVVSGGTLQTPQILELSGIGNPSILSKYGIATVIDLPGVGENLQDHVGVSTIAEVDTNDETMDVLADPAFLKKHEELYQHKQGLFASVPAPAFVFLSADALGSPEDIRSWKEHAQAKNTEFLASASPSLKSGLEKQYKVQQQLFDDKYQSQAELLQFAGRQPMPYAPPAEPGKRYTSLFCALTHPLSRGAVHIASTDPLAPPAIDPNYFANEADLTLVVRVVQAAIRLYKTPPFANHVKKLLLPPPDVIARGEGGLADYVRQNCGPVYHPVGTAAMLPREDGGVVDPTLKVYGTSNLRVVDCSIIPLELSCHTQSIAYAVGEKAADILKSEIARA